MERLAAGSGRQPRGQCKGARTVTVAAVVVAVAASLSVAVSAQPTKTVQDPKNRFTIDVPLSWRVRTSTAIWSPAVSATAPAPSGQVPDSVDVTVRDFMSPITPSACASQAATVMRFSIHEWTTLEEGPVTFKGTQAYTRDYVWRTSTGVSRRSVQTCVTFDRRAFLLVGTTANTPAAVQDSLPQIEDIMATFRPVLSSPPSVPATPTPGRNG